MARLTTWREEDTEELELRSALRLSKPSQENNALTRSSASIYRSNPGTAQIVSPLSGSTPCGLDGICHKELSRIIRL